MRIASAPQHTVVELSPGTLTVDDPLHPALKGVPATFLSPLNEWYSWDPDPRQTPGIKVLMTLAPSNYPIGF